MIIAADTKIAALIKANPATIDAIASINKHFEKLKNPLLRKVLASRVTIADAARIGGCSVARFYEKLEPLGFQAASDLLPETLKKDQPTDMPDKLVQLISLQPLTLDVREDIAAGQDPFQKIMQALERKEKDGALLVITSFVPTPLIALLKKKGFEAYVEEKGVDVVYTYFWSHSIPAAGEPDNSIANTDSFDELLSRFAGRIKHLDVRHLEMPQPMILILQELEHLPVDTALSVQHRRVPQYLLPQLNGRGFTIAIQEVGPAEVNLLLYK